MPTRMREPSLLSGCDAREPASRGAGVIAAAIAICPAFVLRKAAEHQQLAFVRLERLQDVRQIEIRAFAGGVQSGMCAPFGTKRNAMRNGDFLGARSARPARAGPHRVEHRQRDRGAEAAQKSAAMEREAVVHKHGHAW